MIRRGCLITLEGLDGAGKSSHIPAIVDGVRSAGHQVIVTREPGGTALGERLREILLHEAMGARAETLLLFAARAQHLDQVVLPALADGTWVVCDRFTDASFAYQGGGRDLGEDAIALLEAFTHPGLQPDLTLLFDLPWEIAKKRLHRELDRFEKESEAFFNRVREAYLARMRRFPDRIRLIDASADLAKVAGAVSEAMSLAMPALK